MQFDEGLYPSEVGVNINFFYRIIVYVFQLLMRVNKHGKLPFLDVFVNACEDVLFIHFVRVYWVLPAKYFTSLPGKKVKLF